MNRKKKIKLILPVCIIVVLVVGYVIQFQYINSLYPNPPVEQYQIGDTIPYEYTGFELKITDSDWGNANDMIEKYNLSATKNTYLPEEIERILCVSGTITNRNNEERFYDLTSFVCTCDQNYATYSGLMLQPSISSVVTLKPNETYQFTIPYVFLTRSYRPSFLKQLDTEPIQFMLSEYPTIKQVLVHGQE